LGIIFAVISINFLSRYGNDHQPKLMTNIANLKLGAFYYIADLEKISKYFLLAVGGILGACYENIEIVMREVKDNQIIKVYGAEQMWFKNHDLQNYVKLASLSENDKKDFLCEIKIPKSAKQLTDIEKNKHVLTGVVTCQDIMSKTQLKLETKLEIILLNPEEKLEDLQDNEEVELHYLKAKAADAIGIACKKAGESNYKEAQEILDSYMKELEASKYKENLKVQKLRLDIAECKEKCKESIFHQGG